MILSRDDRLHTSQLGTGPRKAVLSAVLLLGYERGRFRQGSERVDLIIAVGGFLWEHLVNSFLLRLLIPTFRFSVGVYCSGYCYFQKIKIKVRSRIHFLVDCDRSMRRNDLRQLLKRSNFGHSFVTDLQVEDFAKYSSFELSNISVLH